MGWSASSDPDRRRDPRVSPQGRVRLDPTPGGVPVQGRLVDVSARGLRVACEDSRLEQGAPVRLEILLQDPDQPDGPPRVVLDGTGHVVWMRDVEAAGPQAGVHFDAPVDVRRSFPQVQIF